MILLIIFAFLAGIVTILSPCILPILPIVLSGSLTGGKKRPLGIITGFIFSFTFFTLALSAIVKTTGLSADGLRTIAIIVITLFGLSMITPKFQIWMEKLFSRLANILPKGSNDTGFVGGIFVGLSLGLLWAPCVGPILASVITLAATNTVNALTILITLSYSVGTAIPMLGITYGGRNLLSRAPWLITNTAKIQRGFGVLMLLTALAIYNNWDRTFQTYILTTFPNYGVGLTKLEDNDFVKNALKSLTTSPQDRTNIGKPMNEVVDDGLGSAPEFISGGEWFNLPAQAGSKPLSMKDLRGSVVLVDFWTYTCINCIRTLPYLKNWYEKYKDDGFVLIGVHTPEFEFEKDSENVAEAITDFGIKYPVMQDNNFATWNAYANRYWPAKYLIDKNGKIRYTHFGEGDYDETERKIQELLEETGATVDTTLNNPVYKIFSRTPELYLGYSRIAYFDSPERIIPNKDSAYTIPTGIPLNTFAYGGTWNIGEERAKPTKGAKLTLHFDASEVFLVMRPTETNVAGGIKVYLDGVPVSDALKGEDVTNSNVKVTTDKLYKLIKLPRPGQHILELEILDPDIELFAFTFG
jgi:cytochrome c biogenesis protein CcdA/thiol-disulfide isomerase/thioredoxin